MDGCKRSTSRTGSSENEHLLKPPVGNKKVFEDGDMTVQMVGGPNERVDYHDDPVEEFFYQLRGDMVLKVGDNGNFYDVPIKEGEVFLLAAAHAAFAATAGRLDRARGRSRTGSRTNSTASNGTASNAARWCTASRSR